MSFLFWLALVIGGGLFLLSLAGDVFGLEGHQGEAFHSDVHGHGHGDSEWGRIFSLRNATYFLFAFGAVGVLLDFMWRGQNTPIAMAAAILTGAAAWFMSAKVFGYLRSTESGEMLGDRVLVGRVGAVTLPLIKGGMGKITVEKAGHSQELLAKPLNDDDANPEQWDSVLVVDVKDGVALVTPFSETQLEVNHEE